mgnify:CR=1 FL=1
MFFFLAGAFCAKGLFNKGFGTFLEGVFFFYSGSQKMNFQHGLTVAALPARVSFTLFWKIKENLETLPCCSVKRKTSVSRRKLRRSHHRLRSVNIIEDKNVEQLAKGLAKDQVQYLLGTPLLNSPLHQNRWDYFYSVKVGDSTIGEKKLSLIFDSNERLDNWILEEVKFEEN